MNHAPNFALLAQGGSFVGILIFVVVVVVNAIAASIKKQSVAGKVTSPPPLPTATTSQAQRPFPTIGAEVAARRARMIEMQSRQEAAKRVPPQSLQAALAEARQKVQRNLKASAPKLAASRVSNVKRKSTPKAQPQKIQQNVSRAPVGAAASMPMPATPSLIQPIAPAARPKPVGATANSLHAWLRPATLRQQFMLTEIFNPPIALRERKW